MSLSHLSETDVRAYILADNKLAEKAGWNRELLGLELQGLIDLNFEVELTGFDTAMPRTRIPSNLVSTVGIERTSGNMPV